jgi:hypothetical protein
MERAHNGTVRGKWSSRRETCPSATGCTISLIRTGPGAGILFPLFLCVTLRNIHTHTLRNAINWVSAINVKQCLALQIAKISKRNTAEILWRCRTTDPDIGVREWIMERFKQNICINVGRSGKVRYLRTTGILEGNTRQIVSFRALLLSYCEEIWNKIFWSVLLYIYIYTYSEQRDITQSKEYIWNYMHPIGVLFSVTNVDNTFLNIYHPEVSLITLSYHYHVILSLSRKWRSVFEMWAQLLF